ncbi:MAG: AbrB/MazE/SpoVT family DNA-binding domain-containing protein [Bacilli bacterium]|nr:AbrB/MazE/SpoVT family DNA-binding domain-containing protein [Bacilli bacterium]
MTTDMKAKGLVAIPPQITKKLGLKKGDLFEITEQDGNIILVPIVIKPRKYLDALEKELAELKQALGVNEEAQPEGE